MSKHVALAHIGFDIAQDFDAARRARLVAIARQHHEIDLGRQPGAMHGADEIGGEDEAAFQHRHDEQAMRRAARRCRRRSSSMRAAISASENRTAMSWPSI